MTAKRIDGTALARKIQNTLKERIEHRRNMPIFRGIPGPGLAVILVGDDPASEIYVNRKAKVCEEVGILSRIIKYPYSCNETDILHTLTRLATDESMHGVIVQLPLPDHIDQRRVVDLIPPMKDVDGAFRSPTVSSG